LLTNERKFKRITAFPEDGEARIELFDSVARKHKLPEEFAKTARILYSSTEMHKKSSVEFPRNENLVICNENYRTLKLNELHLKEQVRKIKLMLQELEKIYLRKKT